MDRAKIEMVKDYMRLPEHRRESMRMDDPVRFDEIIRTSREIMRQWRLEFASEAWISKTITLPDGTVQIVWRRNPGTKKHPFDPNISVGYWPKPWGLMKKVKRGKAPQQSEMYGEISEPEQIGEILKRQ